jgi:hypothetical protein
MTSQVVRAARLLVAIETLAFECRQRIERCRAEDNQAAFAPSTSPADRLDAARSRLQALVPRVEALAGRGTV